jgi:hypothetical protein
MKATPMTTKNTVSNAAHVLLTHIVSPLTRTDQRSTSKLRFYVRENDISASLAEKQVVAAERLCDLSCNACDARLPARMGSHTCKM